MESSPDRRIFETGGSEKDRMRLERMACRGIFVNFPSGHDVKAFSIQMAGCGRFALYHKRARGEESLPAHWKEMNLFFSACGRERTPRRGGREVASTFPIRSSCFVLSVLKETCRGVRIGKVIYDLERPFIWFDKPFTGFDKRWGERIGAI